MKDLFSPEGALNQAAVAAGDFLWSYLLIGLLLLCGIYFTVRTRFVQFRMIGEMFRLLADKCEADSGTRRISSFQAFAVSVATRVGTGNLAGVAAAIAVGGPGAVFWMWLITLIGSATAFVESTLAQLFKRKANDSFVGGPAYYILHGLKSRRMAALFAVLLTLTFGISYNSIQSNTIGGALEGAFGFDPTVTGCVVAAVALVIVFGGIRRIAKFSSLIVPVMAGGYFLLALTVTLMNYKAIPAVFGAIFDNAFGIGQFSGGAIGATILAGVKRGLFSNEAGEGSAPNVAATASVSHPVKQGLIQALGVFTDTLLVCSCTAFIILISGVYADPSLNGIALTQTALDSQIGGSGAVFVAIAIFFFAFSSIIGNYYYGEANILFLTQRKWVLTAFRIFSTGIAVIIGAVASLDLVWSVGDVFMGLLTLVNLIAIVILGKYAFRLLADYRAQKRRGITEPRFSATDSMPEIADHLDWWK